MKRIILSVIAGILILPAAVYAQKAPKMETRMDSISYALGMDIAKNLGQLDLPINAKMLYKGLADVYNEEELPFTETELQSLLMKFQQEAQMAQQKMMEEKARIAKEEGELFLAENKNAEGVITLPSGLQYKVIKEGTGPSPTASDRVEVHYEGKFLDESIFDSSIQRGTPATFGVTQVIRGWTEALQLMKVGSKWQLYIPSDLAYGERGYPPNIPPNSALIFDVELLSIQ